MKKKKYMQRDIVVIEVPFSECKQIKIRLVLIISNSLLAKVNEFVFLTLTDTRFKDNLEIHINDKMVITDLPKKSYIRLNKNASIDKNLIMRRVNELKPRYFNHIIKKLTTEYGGELKRYEALDQTVKGGLLPLDAIYMTPSSPHQLAMMPYISIQVELKTGVDALYVTRFQTERLSATDGVDGLKANYPVVDK